MTVGNSKEEILVGRDLIRKRSLKVLAGAPISPNASADPGDPRLGEPWNINFVWRGARRGAGSSTKIDRGKK